MATNTTNPTTTSHTHNKTTPPDHEQTLQDSGYLSQPLEDSSSDQITSTNELTSSTTHLKTSSISSSGYYSRLDSTDFDDLQKIPEQQEVNNHPWQYYVTPEKEEELTPLHTSVINKDRVLLQKIITLLPHPTLINTQTDHTRQTALHLAVLINDPETTRLLIINGASASVKDLNGDNPVHIACRYGFGECLEAVVRAVGAGEGKVVNNSVGAAVGAVNYEGLTPLHLATLSYSPMSSGTPLQTLLYMSSVNVGCQDGRSGRTPLHLAIESRSLPALKLLLNYATKSELEIENYSGLTAYTLASCNCLGEFCIALRSKGVVEVDYFSSSESEGEE